MKRIVIWILALVVALGLCTALTAAADPAGAQADYPSVVSITPGTNGFTLKWSAYDGAVKYRLFYRKNGTWARVGDTAGTSLNHSGLADGTAYTYTVRALDGSGRYCSRYSVPGWTKTYYAAPKLTAAASGNAMCVKWNTIPGADCYRLYKRVGGAWKGIAFVDGNSYLDEEVASGDTCTYTVRGVNAAHTEFLSAYSASGVSVRFVAVPVITRTESFDGIVRIRWNPTPGAVRYRVFYKNGASWKTIGNTAAAYFDYRVGEVPLTHTYTVRALNESGAFASDYSREGMTHTYLAAPVLKAVENVVGGQKVSWQPVDGAALYRVYRKTPTAWTKIAEVGETSCLADGLANNTTYTYTVRCLSADGITLQSYFDRRGISRTYFEAPEVTAITNLASGALIEWPEYEGAARFRVFLRADGKWQRINDIEGTTCLHGDAEDGVTYTYTVRAMDSRDRYISGYCFPGFTNTYYAPPAFSEVIPAAGSTELHWEPREGVAGYRVYRREYGASWRRLDSIEGTAYTDTTAPADVPYQYTLRCLDENGNTVSGHLTDNPYYYNGAIADGELPVRGSTLTFDNGIYRNGYVSAQDILRVAMAEVGTKATYYKSCKYNTWYYGHEVSGDSFDWCGVFVNWVFNEAGAYDILCTKAANCGQMGWDFQQCGRLVTSGYTVGDILFLHWDDSPSTYVPGMKSLDHAAIVASVNDDGSYTTVEGNTGPTNGGEVMIRTRYEYQISCAGRPAYGYVNSVSKADVAATGAWDRVLPNIPPGGEYRMREMGLIDSSPIML